MRLVVATLLLAGLIGGGCSSGADDGTDEVAADDTSPSDDEDDADASSTTTTAAAGDCPDPSTTTTTGQPTICAAIERIPEDERPADPADEEHWRGAVDGVIQTPGCDPVTQSGTILLAVVPDGTVWGVGVTVSGAYTCENGAAIPEMLNDYYVDGTKSDVFTLTFADGVALTSTPIEDGHATMVQDTGFGTVTIEFTCEENC